MIEAYEYDEGRALHHRALKTVFHGQNKTEQVFALRVKILFSLKKSDVISGVSDIQPNVVANIE